MIERDEIALNAVDCHCMVERLKARAGRQQADIWRVMANTERHHDYR